MAEARVAALLRPPEIWPLHQAADRPSCAFVVVLSGCFDAQAFTGPASADQTRPDLLLCRQVVRTQVASPTC